MFGIGGTSVISRALGEGRNDYAKKVCSFCMWSCVGVGILMSALFPLFMDPILSLIGVSAETWAYAKNYLTIVSCSGPFVLIANCYSNIIRAEGQSGKAALWLCLRRCAPPYGLHLLIFPQPLGRALKNQNAAPASAPCFRRRRRSPPLLFESCTVHHEKSPQTECLAASFLVDIPSRWEPRTNQSPTGALIAFAALGTCCSSCLLYTSRCV